VSDGRKDLLMWRVTWKRRSSPDEMTCLWMARGEAHAFAVELLRDWNTEKVSIQPVKVACDVDSSD
jgi:hypothetical protein